jgi:hypothetical protein
MLNPKRTNPTASEARRRIDSGLNFVSGIGIYQIIAQMARKTSKFKSLPQVEVWSFQYLNQLRIEQVYVLKSYICKEDIVGWGD